MRSQISSEQLKFPMLLLPLLHLLLNKKYNWRQQASMSLVNNLDPRAPDSMFISTD